MNTPNPLMPQGALEAKATNKRSMIKIVVSTILAIHGVVLGGLLFLGCKEEVTLPEKPYTDTGLVAEDPIVDEDNPFAGLPGLGLPDTSEAPPIPGSAGDSGTVGGLPPIPPGGGVDDGDGFVLSESATLQGEVAQLGNFPPESDPVPVVVEEMTPYVILPGDNYYKIADKHNLKVNDISRANPGVDPRKLQVGDELNLPPNVTAMTPDVPEAGGQSSTAETMYTVKSGDNLTRISKKYGVTVKAIQKANGLSGDKIRVGLKLVIPLPKN